MGDVKCGRMEDPWIRVSGGLWGLMRRRPGCWEPDDGDSDLGWEGRISLGRTESWLLGTDYRTWGRWPGACGEGLVTLGDNTIKTIWTFISKPDQKKYKLSCSG